MISEAGRKPRPFDIVVVYNWSRFFRDATEALFYIRKLDRLGVRVRAVTQDVTDDASGRLLRTILAATDEHASEMIGERTLGGMEENIRQGFVNGIAPFGYRSVAAGQRGDKFKKRFEPAPQEADTVRQIFDLYMQGDGTTGPMGIKKVVEHLNRRDYRQRNGEPFSIKVLHKILRNDTYAGTYYWNKTDSRTLLAKPREEWVTAKVPPIVSQELFDAVQARLKQNNPKMTAPRRVNTPILLSGLIFCGHCGSAMTRGAGKDSRYRYYMCSGKNRVGSAKCRGQWMPMPDVDNAVMDAFIQDVLDPARLIEIVRRVEDEIRAKDVSANGAKQSLEAELRRTQRELDNIVGAVARGVLGDDDAREQLTRRKAEVQDIHRRMTASQPGPLIALNGLTDARVRRFGDALGTLLRDGDTKFRQAYLRLFIERIEAKDGELTISGSPEALAGAASNDNNGPESGVHAFMVRWRPHGDSNPGYRRERAMS